MQPPQSSYIKRTYVNVISSRGIPSTINPIIQITFTNCKKKIRFPITAGTEENEIGEELVFHSPDPNSILKISVMNHGHLTDSFFGQVSVSIASIPENFVVNRWCRLGPKETTGPSPFIGEIHFIIHYQTQDIEVWDAATLNRWNPLFEKSRAFIIKSPFRNLAAFTAIGNSANSSTLDSLSVDCLSLVNPKEAQKYWYKLSTDFTSQDFPLQQFLNLIIMQEVQLTTKRETIFRGNSFCTKFLTRFGHFSGFNFIKSAITPILDTVFKDHTNFEVDPKRIPEHENLETNQANLLKLVRMFIDSILASFAVAPNGDYVNHPHLVPLEIRYICRLLSIHTQKFDGAQRVIIGGYMFLRLLCPSLISPDGFKFITSPPSPPVRRVLVLVAKICQNIANNVEFGSKQTIFVFINPFLRETVTRLNSGFDFLASSAPEYLENPVQAVVKPSLSSKQANEDQTNFEFHQECFSNLVRFHRDIISSIPRLRQRMSKIEAAGRALQKLGYDPTAPVYDSSEELELIEDDEEPESVHVADSPVDDIDHNLPPPPVTDSGVIAADDKGDTSGFGDDLPPPPLPDIGNDLPPPPDLNIIDTLPPPPEDTVNTLPPPQTVDTTAPLPPQTDVPDVDTSQPKSQNPPTNSEQSSLLPPLKEQSQQPSTSETLQTSPKVREILNSAKTKQIARSLSTHLKTTSKSFLAPTLTDFERFYKSFSPLPHKELLQLFTHPVDEIKMKQVIRLRKTKGKKQSSANIIVSTNTGPEKTDIGMFFFRKSQGGLPINISLSKNAPTLGKESNCFSILFDSIDLFCSCIPAESEINWKHVGKHDLFNSFLDSVSLFANCSFANMSDTDILLFFLQLYPLMFYHTLTITGSPGPNCLHLYQYLISGMRFCLNDILNGILRSNFIPNIIGTGEESTVSISSGTPWFAESDPRGHILSGNPEFEVPVDMLMVLAHICFQPIVPLSIVSKSQNSKSNSVEVPTGGTNDDPPPLLSSLDIDLPPMLSSSSLDLPPMLSSDSPSSVDIPPLLSSDSSVKPIVDKSDQVSHPPMMDDIGGLPPLLSGSDLQSHDNPDSSDVLNNLKPPPLAVSLDDLSIQPSQPPQPLQSPPQPSKPKENLSKKLAKPDSLYFTNRGPCALHFFPPGELTKQIKPIIAKLLLHCIYIDRKKLVIYLPDFFKRFQFDIHFTLTMKKNAALDNHKAKNKSFRFRKKKPIKNSVSSGRLSKSSNALSKTLGKKLKLIRQNTVSDIEANGAKHIVRWLSQNFSSQHPYFDVFHSIRSEMEADAQKGHDPTARLQFYPLSIFSESSINVDCLFRQQLDEFEKVKELVDRFYK